MEFDFDSWTRLAKEDPEEFERQRRAAVHAAIAAAPSEHRERLERVQFRLDLERERAGSPLDSCLRMNSLMWAGFFRLRKELSRITPGAPESAEPKTSAQVISIARYQQARRIAPSGER